LSIFRLLSILAGVQARARQGNASSVHADVISSDAVLAALAEAALDIVARADTGAVTATSSSDLAPLSNGGSAGRDSRQGSGGALGKQQQQQQQGTSAGLGQPSSKAQQLLQQLKQFMAHEVFPNEEVFEAHASGPNR
jgi:hypothetical protein